MGRVPENPSVILPKTLLCRTEHSAKTFLSPLSHPVQVVFQLVFISTLWLVFSGPWVPGFLRLAESTLFNVNRWTRCQLRGIHSTAVILWCWLGKQSCIKQECLLSPFHMGRESVQLRPPWEHPESEVPRVRPADMGQACWLTHFQGTTPGEPQGLEHFFYLIQNLHVEGMCVQRGQHNGTTSNPPPVAAT